VIPPSAWLPIRRRISTLSGGVVLVVKEIDHPYQSTVRGLIPRARVSDELGGVKIDESCLIRHQRALFGYHVNDSRMRSGRLRLIISVLFFVIHISFARSRLILSYPEVPIVRYLCCGLYQPARL
jgi:hypothetical protein